MRLAAFTFAAASCALPVTAAAFPVTVLQQAGPATQRFNIAILGDGYRAQDQSKLTNDARTLVDELFAVEPYKPYRQLFNFKVIQSVSLDQGAKGGSQAGTPNTLFGAYFNCQDVSQLICMNDSDVLAAAAADAPELNLAVVIVNDSKYGGAGGNVPCVSTDEGAAEILRHELGHTLANLADEYADPYPDYPACSPSKDCTEPNATLRSVRSQIKWLDWLDDATPVPTKAGQTFAGVGVFEGARYLQKGLYRPVDTDCKMQTLGNPFCPVCSEALVRSFWNLENVSLIDRAVPASELSETTCIDALFSIETPSIAPSTLTFSWAVDGQPAASHESSLQLAAGALSAGPHRVVATVRDATLLVRNDPNGSLSESHSFDFNAPACERVPAPAEAGTAGESSTDPRAEMNASGSGSALGSAGNPSLKPPPPAESVGCNCRLGKASGRRLPLGLAALLGLVTLLRRRRAVRA